MVQISAPLGAVAARVGRHFPFRRWVRDGVEPDERIVEMLEVFCPEVAECVRRAQQDGRSLRAALEEVCREA